MILFFLLGMDRAVERLTTAVKKREKICVYGDYDVDGISAVALLISFLREIGADCFYHIPKRLEEGYGLSREGIESAASLGADLIVTVDCGITADEESVFCGSIGVDLIITDHHAPGPTIPKRVRSSTPTSRIVPFRSSLSPESALPFYLLIAFRSRLRQEKHFYRSGSA